MKNFTSETKEEIREYLAEHFGFDKEEVTDDSTFVEDLSSDDLDMLEIVVEMEYKYNIDISDEEMVHVLKVSDFFKVVENSKGK